MFHSESKGWSPQLIFQFKQLERRSRCDALAAHESKGWSSQLIFQFKQLERRSLKKSGLQRDSNPWPPRTSVPRCSTNWAMKPQFAWKRSFFTCTAALQIWIISYILHIISLLTGEINSINWPCSQCVVDCEPSLFFLQLRETARSLNVWLHSSVGRASHRYSRRSRGSNPVEALIFSGFFFPIV